MKISSKTDYALRTVIDLALNKSDGVTQAGLIAKRQNISRDYLGQILMTLKNANIVNSKRGLEGGYTLNRDPSEITLRSIVELTNSSLLKPLPSTGYETDLPEKKAIANIWNSLTEHAAEVLEKTTVKDICDQVNNLKDKPSIDYTI